MVGRCWPRLACAASRRIGPGGPGGRDEGSPRRCGARAFRWRCSRQRSGCSSDDSEDASATSSTTVAASDETTTTAAEVLTILVSNDDGYGAPGIDAVVRALDALPDTEVVVVAPAENQSGSGSNTTEGELEVTQVETASGFPVTAVAGFPADAVNWALDGGLEVTPDLVVSGINSGQNLGAVGDQLSGTVGAARAAAAAGIPAVATSTALNDAVDYDVAAEYVVEWVEETSRGAAVGRAQRRRGAARGTEHPVLRHGRDPRGDRGPDVGRERRRDRGPGLHLHPGGSGGRHHGVQQRVRHDLRGSAPSSSLTSGASAPDQLNPPSSVIRDQPLTEGRPWRSLCGCAELGRHHLGKGRT